MKNFFGLMLFVAMLSVRAAGFYELDSDWHSPGKQVATLTVGGSVGQFSPMLIVDSTEYYEGFVGRPFAVGQISFVPYVGVEGMKGVNPRPRGLLISSTQLGSLHAMMLNEFGGVTGNFHKERLWVDAGRYSLGLVNHRFAGFGPRLDYRL